jgi:molybdopterin/thiamine biosynthesis adenylyltransferase/proteasome lid subunit RPN8/RPN11
MADPEANQLLSLLFSRYPEDEWATFARFGWRETDNHLIVTLAVLDEPREDELDNEVRHVAIDEAYTLRIALAAENHPLAVGILHSHPSEYLPAPSPIDDDMDGYYSQYFADFAPGRPYISLIASQIRGELTVSGRVYWRSEWHRVTRVVAERRPLTTWRPTTETGSPKRKERYARLAAAYGADAQERLRRSSVAVIGAGGTGSAAIEVLARAGVGQLLMIDPDCLESSNLERVHGSTPQDADAARYKVEIAALHVQSINPDCDIRPIIGSVPQDEILDAILTADLALGCTDQQHSRVALSDLALRYLLPAIDCGVAMEGANGEVTGQIIQLVRYLSADACVLCRRMIDPPRLAQELMSADERLSRQNAAKDAEARGEPGQAYWRDTPQLNTVGYLTTMAGAMVAGYAIGWITGRFDPPFEWLQMNLLAPWFDVTDTPTAPDGECVCRRVRGWADQALADALISTPRHWPPAKTIPTER